MGDYNLYVRHPLHFEGRRSAQAERGQACVVRTTAVPSDRCHCRETVMLLFQFPICVSIHQQTSFCLREHQTVFLLVDIELLSKLDLC